MSALVALAKSLDEPLLFKGNDFSKTNIKARARRRLGPTRRAACDAARALLEKAGVEMPG